MNTTRIARFSHLLQRALLLPRPRATSLSQFAPELAYGRHAGPMRSSVKPSAVLVLLYPEPSDWSVILTVRQAHLLTHAGQVCFPGGRMEANETPEETALREFTEEVGAPGEITFAGRLSPVFVYASNYRVIPCVAIAAKKPELHPQPEEVADVLSISLPNFRQNAKHATYKIQRGALQFTAPSYKVGARFLWGATWIMLGDLLDRIEAVGPLTGW